MAKYRKKPVVIDAFLMTAPDDGIRWIDGFESPSKISVFENCEGGLVIQTLEGNMTAQPGDWIIRGVKGEFTPCKPDIFEATYAPEPRPDKDQP